MTTVVRLLLVLSLFFRASAAPAQPKPEKLTPPPTTFDVDAIDKYVAAHVKEKDFVGLSLGVMRDGNVVLAKGYGKRSLEDGSPVEADTRFAIGSVTKQFVAACILLLAEEGKLSVHDPVSKWYPDLTRAKNVTLYDLMTHASGYPDYYPLDFVDRRLAKPIAAEQLIKEYATGNLDFEPGTRWSYSNTGFIILGRVVEKVSGESLGAFLERRILKPLGMEHTVYEPKKTDAGFARGYTSFGLGAHEPAPREADGWCGAAGGLYSTAGDLLKWDLALAEGKVLKPESYRLLTTPRTLRTGKTKNYGCGLQVSQQDGERVLSHGGAVSGFLTQNLILPDARSAVVVLANSDVVDSSAVAHTVLSLLVKREDGPNVAVPKIDGPTAKDAVRGMLNQLAKGEVDRSKLGEEFSLYLTDERVKGVQERLKPLGQPTSVETDRAGERGGLEVVTFRIGYKSGAVRGIMYRSPDGKVQQFFLNKD
jgi:CubicO group peptidase (beta-lactamase class C family)